MSDAVFFCHRLGRRVKVSFCGSACRECTRWRSYADGERAPSPGVVGVPCGGATTCGNSPSDGEASSYQTAFEMFFGVKP